MGDVMPASSTWNITSGRVVSYAGCIGVAWSAAAVVSSKATGHPLGSNFHRYFSAQIWGVFFTKNTVKFHVYFVLIFMKITVFFMGIFQRKFLDLSAVVSRSGHGKECDSSELSVSRCGGPFEGPSWTNWVRRFDCAHLKHHISNSNRRFSTVFGCFRALL